MARDLSPLSVGLDDQIRSAIRRIDAGACGIALVVNDAGRLFATITDGDIRRAILSGQDMATSVRCFIDDRAAKGHPPPVTAPEGTSGVELLQLMRGRDVRQVPLVHDEDRVVDLVTLEDVLPPPGPPCAP